MDKKADENAFSESISTALKQKNEKGFFAVGEVREFEDGTAIKPIKQFDT